MSGVKNENGGGSIHRDAAGRWVAKTTDLDGRRRKRIGRSQNEARKALRELLADRDRRLSGEATISASLTVDALLELWWDGDFLARDPAPVRGTRDAYNYCVGNLRRVLGRSKAASVATHHVTEAFKELATMGRTSDGVMSRSHLSRHRNILSQAFEYAIGHELLLRSPAKRVRLPRTARAEEPRRSLDLEQFAAFIEAARQHRRGALFIIGATVGLRPGELTALCWDKVDLDAGVIEVARGSRPTFRSVPSDFPPLPTMPSSRTPAVSAQPVSTPLRAHWSSPPPTATSSTHAISRRRCVR